MHSVILEDLTEILSAPLDWGRFGGKRVLISGASGFLPGYMARTLLHLNDVLDLDCHVVGLVRNLKRAQAVFGELLNRPQLRLIECDVSGAIPVDLRCDFVIHAASQASPKYFGSDPVGTMACNLFGTYHLLECAREWKSEGFLLFSSGEVYGQVSKDSVPTHESGYGFLEILDSRSCYAESKRAAETLTASYFAQFEVPGVVVRPFHTYGPGMRLDDGRVFADFVGAIVRRENLVLHSDGQAIRSFCYLADAVSGFFTALLRGESGQAYNVGNPGGSLSVRNLAELLVGLYPELKLEVEYLDRSDSGYMPSPISINCPKIDRIGRLGWQPRTIPAVGFEKTIRFYSNRSIE